jgi:hypothetical protein
MSITYPLTLPTTVDPASFSLYVAHSVSENRSPYSKREQVHDFGGGSWILEATFPLLTEDLADEYLGFISSLKGQWGTFKAGNHRRRTIKGAGLGQSPRVQTSGQTGTSLLTHNWTPSTSNIMRQGDFFELNGSLHMVTQNASSDGIGDALLEITPELRAATVDEDPITIADPKGTFRLVESRPELIKMGLDRLYAVSIKAMEAVQ